MNLCEVICSVILMGISAGFFGSTLQPARVVWEKYSQKKIEYEMDSFIAESFTQLCSENQKSASDIEEWKKICSSLFELKDIEVKKEGGSLYKCIWKTDKGEKSIICRRNE